MVPMTAATGMGPYACGKAWPEAYESSSTRTGGLTPPRSEVIASQFKSRFISSAQLSNCPCDGNEIAITASRNATTPYVQTCFSMM